MSSLGDLYNHLKTLCEQWSYNKNEVDTFLSNKISKSSEIPANADLNTYKNEGLYRCPINADASTISNTPQGVSEAFSLIVEHTTANSGCIQTLTLFHPTKPVYKWVRTYYNNIWGDWHRISSDKSFLGKTTSTSGSGGFTTHIGGYVRLLSIKTNTTYYNTPITFTISQRNRTHLTEMSIRFVNNGNNPQEIESFTYVGEQITAYLHYSNTNTWDLYVQKTETNERIEVYDFHENWEFTTANKLNYTVINEEIAEFSLPTTNITKAIPYYVYIGEHREFYDASTYSLTTSATSSSNKRKFAFREDIIVDNSVDWVVEGELNITGNRTMFRMANPQLPNNNWLNYLGLGANYEGKLAFWWTTSQDGGESSQVYTVEDIPLNEWNTFKIEKNGSNITYTFNNTKTHTLTLSYIPSLPYLQPMLYKYGANDVSIRNLKVYYRANLEHEHNSWISYGQVDSSSTSTVFTATVSNVDKLSDGTTVMLRNGVVNSTTGFTLNVNNLGAKPVYSSMHNSTADTTIFKLDYTMLFVYDSTRISGGCWICYRGYNTNDNTIGYQIRTNSTKFTATDKGYRYRIWLETDDGKYMPVNLSTSTNNTANRSSAMNTREFWIGGKILYNSTDGTTNANAKMSATTLWQQYPISLGYSFNNTGSALTLTSDSPLYMVATPTSNGKARLTSPYYTQTLPSSADGLIYIYLGQMYSATNLELALKHPIYEYKNGAIRTYQGDTVEVTVTYSDNTTETIELLRSS